MTPVGLIPLVDGSMTDDRRLKNPRFKRFSDFSSVN